MQVKPKHLEKYLGKEENTGKKKTNPDDLLNSKYRIMQQTKSKPKSIGIKVFDEDDENEKMNLQNSDNEEQNKNRAKYNEESKWVNMDKPNEEEDEVEYEAFEQAKKEFIKNQHLNKGQITTNQEVEIQASKITNDSYSSNSESESENVLKKKRKRHDTDDENESESSKSQKSQGRKSENTEDELNELLRDEDGDLILDDDNDGERVDNKAGLMTVLEFKNTTKKQRMQTFSNLEVNQPTIYRDKMGRKIDPSETVEQKKKKLEEMNYKELSKWSKGTKQLEDKKANLEEQQKMLHEPMTRYEVDKQTDDVLKQKDRFGDPMKRLIDHNKLNKLNQKTDKEEEGNLSEEGRLRNEISRNKEKSVTLPKKVYSISLKCRFKGLPNRFSIEPGYMWDGVDRSTGFERRILESRNLRQAREEEYHKLRTEDM